ncbi:MAG: hypothetical protein IAE97_05950 [Chthoniobacterales bacterium]|nr:hypothetical protein [Chthoniobacterales bacterium]
MIALELIHLAAPVAALASMCVIHAVWCRMAPDAPLLNTLAASGVGGLAVLAGVELAAVSAGQPVRDMVVAAVLVDAPIFACLAYGYANFVNLGQSSVRVRIYRELLQMPDGVAIETLREEYDEHGMLRSRLERLVSAGDLRKDGGGVYRSGKSRLQHIASVIFGLKRFVLGRHSEFNP